MINSANGHLKDEFLRSQNALRVNIETIIDIIKKEITKDIQFEIDEKKLYDYEMPDLIKEQNGLIQYLQYSLLDQIKNEDGL
jgi:hypothetical protein